MNTGTRRIFDIFQRNAAAGVKIAQHFDAPVELLQKTHQIGLVRGDLHVGTQRVKRAGGQREIKLAAEIENSLGTDIAIKVAVNIGKRKLLVDHGALACQE